MWRRHRVVAGRLEFEADVVSLFASRQRAVRASLHDDDNDDKQTTTAMGTIEYSSAAISTLYRLLAYCYLRVVRIFPGYSRIVQSMSNHDSMIGSYTTSEARHPLSIPRIYHFTLLRLDTTTEGAREKRGQREDREWRKCSGIITT